MPRRRRASRSRRDSSVAAATPGTVPTSSRPSGSSTCTSTERAAVAGTWSRRRGDERLDDRIDAARAPARPSGPGGSTPRARSAAIAASLLGAGEPGVEQPIADAPLLERVELDRQRVVERRRRTSLPPRPRRWRRNARDRVLDEARRARRARPRGSALARQAVRRGTAAWRPGRPPAPARRRARRVEAPRPLAGTSPPAAKLRGSNGCSGCSTITRSRAGAAVGGRAVRSTTSSSSPSGTAGGRSEVRALVAARVGDRPGGRSRRAARRAAAGGPRCARRGRRRAGRRASRSSPSRAVLPREDAVVEAHQADDPVRHRAHRDERADREVAGAEVGSGRAARAAGRRAARGSRPAPAASASTRRRSCLGDDLVEQAPELRRAATRRGGGGA